MDILCSPHTEDIELELNSRNILNNRVLHLTPTLILYRRRLKYYARKWSLQIQVNKNSTKDSNIEKELHKYIDLYEINQFLKKLRYSSQVKTITKSEASVILERVIKENPDTNNPSWLSVLHDLGVLFYELNLSGINSVELRLFDPSKKWSQTIDIYEKYLNQLRATNVFDGAQSSFNALSDLDLSGYSELILDGAFLPISPILQLIIEKFNIQGKPITVLLPYDLETPDHPALKAVKTIYQNFKPVSEWRSIQEIKSQSHFINQLPKNIFRSDKQIYLDASLEILKFNTLEEELTYIMQKIFVLIKYKEISPKNIVIITPGAMELRPIIREISEQYNLKVHLPKRPLMHLSQGRAIKHLFDIHTDIRKERDSYFTIKMMKIILSNSLLKHSESLLNAFEKVECFFEDSVSIHDFIEKIDSLLAAKPLIDLNHQQHPLNGVDESQLNEVKAVLQHILEISSTLIKGKARTVGEHIQNLINTLETDPQIIDISPLIWERILKITDNVTNQQNITISGFEFGSRISALFTENEEFEEGDKPVEDENDIFLEKEILVTGPNNVEFQRYDYVFLCRFTQDKYPETKTHKWYSSKQVEQQILLHKTNFKISDPKILETFYLDRAMYHLYLTMRAPGTQLTISYSSMENGQPLTPAHYLHDIAKVFGVEEGNRLENKKEPSLEALLENYGVIKNPVMITAAPSTDNNHERKKADLIERSFTAEEVAIFQYCQRRFYYQSKHQSENQYTQIFHLQSYASSCLYERAIELFISNETFPVVASIDSNKQQVRLTANMKTYRRTAEEAIRTIFPFGNRQWHNVVAQTDFFLESLLKNIFENQFVKELRSNGFSTISVNMKLDNSPDIIRIDDFRFSSIKELEVQYYNRMIHRYSISNRKDILSFSSKNYDEADSMEEIKNWYFNFKREFRSKSEAVVNVLNEVVAAVKNGDFKKNTGGHCMYCTFNKICREREVDL
ncbi:hypothetical protein [Paenibacillus sp. NRS-1760]|uniref:hypothetical protein n=1 Tax=Paenibacillus sp. NRS-1760 TaxID=3233902 RepID=UPI003D2ABA3F